MRFCVQTWTDISAEPVITGYTAEIGAVDPFMADNVVVDAIGKRCPMPLLMAKRALAELPEGGEIVLLATDPAAATDLETFGRRHGHTVVCEQDETHMRICIAKHSRSGGRHD